MLRVIAGTARSIPLVAPDGLDTRPTQDRVKETLFNIIQGEIPGSIFVDLCAGSGSIGIEAISRGARKAYFVENRNDAFTCIQQNVHKTHFEEKAILLKQDVLSALDHIHEKHVDVVYLDPPYASPIQLRALLKLAAMPYVTEETLLIVEADRESVFDEEELARAGLEITREKLYKNNKHVFLRRREAI